ncbi:hypothetical protein, partial [Cryobacterium sp. Y57]|uniref:hypothetical protein n=1 Tax=Cryobacterium sp. Y57 TaxID=2048287 RepID=UPI001E5B6ED4
KTHWRCMHGFETLSHRFKTEGRPPIPDPATVTVTSAAGDRLADAADPHDELRGSVRLGDGVL